MRGRERRTSWNRWEKMMIQKKTAPMEDSDEEILVGEPKGGMKEPYYTDEQDGERDTGKRGTKEGNSRMKHK